jgi:soluble lytic murein transglycosylase
MSVNSVGVFDGGESHIAEQTPPRANSDLAAAAEQFEALFLQQVLKQMRKASDALSGDSSFKSREQATINDFYDDALAQKLAGNKQTGLADLIVRELSGNQAQSPDKLQQASHTAQHAALPNPLATSLYGNSSARESLRVQSPNSFIQLYKNAQQPQSTDALAELGYKTVTALKNTRSSINNVLSKSDFFALVKRVIQQESGGLVDAISPKGALGLMQLMPSTAREMAQETGVAYSAQRLIKDPQYNMKLGMAYLEKMMERYNHSAPLALAAYNAGPGRVDNWLKTYGDPRTSQISENDWMKKIPIQETRDYTTTILNGFKRSAPEAATHIQFNKMNNGVALHQENANIAANSNKAKMSATLSAPITTDYLRATGAHTSGMVTPTRFIATPIILQSFAPALRRHAPETDK